MQFKCPYPLPQKKNFTFLNVLSFERILFITPSNKNHLHPNRLVLNSSLFHHGPKITIHFSISSPSTDIFICFSRISSVAIDLHSPDVRFSTQQIAITTVVFETLWKTYVSLITTDFNYCVRVFHFDFDHTVNVVQEQCSTAIENYVVAVVILWDNKQCKR